MEKWEWKEGAGQAGASRPAGTVFLGRDHRAGYNMLGTGSVHAALCLSVMTVSYEQAAPISLQRPPVSADSAAFPQHKNGSR